MDAFDYVVIGAGTAGCVVASRLAESGRNRVLLLEAGGTDRRLWIQLPIGYGRTYFDARVNWMYDTEPVEGLGGRSSYWPRGKVVGGSGSINAMVHMRGLAQDFDDWRAMGNPGWGWDDVLPWFIRAEDHDLGAGPWHGAGGPQHVSEIGNAVHPLCRSFIAAGEALGLPFAPDLNAPEADGLGIYQINTRGGRRDSTANAYLRPALKRGNLRLETGAQATRLLFEGRRVVGVEYRQHGRLHRVNAGAEVILAGGAVNSPQLLQLSGVGDPELLGRHGIEVVAAQKQVGRNLQDHLAVSYFYRTNVPTLNNQLAPRWGKVRAGLRYLYDRGGPLSMSVNQAGGYARSDPALDRPNLQLYFTPASYIGTPLSERRLLNPDPFPAVLMGFNACRPTSRGHLEIRSADPFDYPLIQPNYLSTEHDLAEARGGLRLVRALAASAPLAGVIEEELVPGPAVASEAELLADLRARADTVYHPCSTCAMGPDPATAVVDTRLRVHGLGGLRVIDASAFPAITSGNLNAPTVMLAEKGAAMALEDQANL